MAAADILQAGLPQVQAIRLITPENSSLPVLTSVPGIPLSWR